MQVRISVIIVSYNSESFIEKCIVSVLKNLLTNAEVIVLDNASTDKTLEVLSKLKVKSEKLKVIESKINLGFAKGNNLASKEASGEYLFFLNPDTEIEKPIFDELLKFYEENADVGIVGPKLLMGNGEVQASVRKLPTVWGAFKEYILGTKFAYSEYIPNGNEPVEVEMVYGAAMLIKKDLFEKVGGFNEKYFLYYEDVDICKKIQKTGKKVYFYPGVSIKHLVGATRSELNKVEINYNSSLLYHGLVGGLILQIIFFIYRLRRHL